MPPESSQLGIEGLFADQALAGLGNREPAEPDAPRSLYARVAVEMSVRQKVRLLAPSARSSWEPESPWIRAFHYSVPPQLVDHIAVGQLVWTPFGRQKVQGIVLGFDAVPPVSNLKALIRIVDPLPVVTAQQIALARWLSAHYYAPLFDTLALMLPAGLMRQVKTYVSLPADSGTAQGTDELSRKQRSILLAIGEEGRLLESKARKRFGAKEVATLLNMGVLIQVDELPLPRVKAKVERVARLVQCGEALAERRAELGRDHPGARIIAWLAARRDAGAPTVPETMEATAASRGDLNALRRQGLIGISAERTLLRVAATQGEGADLSALSQSLTPKQALVHDLLAERGEWEVGHLLAEAGVSRSVLDALVSKGVAEKETVESRAELLVAPEGAGQAVLRLRGAERQAAIIDLLEQAGGELSLGELRSQGSYSSAALDDLEGRGIVILEERQVRRDPLQDRVYGAPPSHQLTPAQRRALEAIAPHVRQGSPHSFLVQGVTGSGKTEVYLRAAREAVDLGKRVIILVPEISLTPQAISRFGARFDNLAILHSRLSPGERYDEWSRIREGEVDVVVGPRSALFAPLDRLGLIVLDEEHETSYKQEPIPGQHVPAYHAREAALRLGEICNAPVILGSATPSLDSRYWAERGRHVLIEMPRRVLGHVSDADRGPEPSFTDLPPVYVVDLRQELRAGNRSIFSRVLREAMGETLSAGQQAILFLNRRGASTFVMCRDCGTVLECDRCHVPLSYHASGQDLVCHRCNQREPSPAACPECGGKRIRYFGIGTQGVEEAARQAWPEARILRWDSDAVSRGLSSDEVMDKLERHEIDILVGTQMIAKGLDLPLVTLVGVVTADTALNLPDYTSGERTYQLLEQVSGRAGRGALGGRVFVQTYAPDHYAVRAASEHDYAGFYKQEIEFRREQGYPPVGRLAKLVYSAPDVSEARDEAQRMVEFLGTRLEQMPYPRPDLIGPAPSFFSPLGGRHRWQILVLGREIASLLDQVPFQPGWQVDVDPISAL